MLNRTNNRPPKIKVSCLSTATHGSVAEGEQSMLQPMLSFGSSFPRTSLTSPAAHLHSLLLQNTSSRLPPQSLLRAHTTPPRSLSRPRSLTWSPCLASSVFGSHAAYAAGMGSGLADEMKLGSRCHRHSCRQQQHCHYIRIFIRKFAGFEAKNGYSNLRTLSNSRSSSRAGVSTLQPASFLKALQ